LKFLNKKKQKNKVKLSKILKFWKVKNENSKNLFLFFEIIGNR